MGDLRFNIGSQHKGRKGIYKVISIINQKVVKIKYATNGNDFDEKEQEVNVDFLRRMENNIQRESTEFEAHVHSCQPKKLSMESKIKRHKKEMHKINTMINSHIVSGAIPSSKNFFKSIGYFAKSGHMHAFMSDKYTDTFISKYKDMTGDYPKGHIIHVTDQYKNPRKWGIELRLSYNLPHGISSKNIDLGPFTGYVEPVSGSNYEYNINNNNFCWYLISIGFRVGKDHPTDIILSNIPDEYKEDFKEGYCSTLN